jgi:hypothetical protein
MNTQIHHRTHLWPAWGMWAARGYIIRNAGNPATLQASCSCMKKTPEAMAAAQEGRPLFRAHDEATTTAALAAGQRAGTQTIVRARTPGPTTVKGDAAARWPDIPGRGRYGSPCDASGHRTVVNLSRRHSSTHRRSKTWPHRDDHHHSQLFRAHAHRGGTVGGGNTCFYFVVCIVWGIECRCHLNPMRWTWECCQKSIIIVYMC